MAPRFRRVAFASFLLLVALVLAGCARDTAAPQAPAAGVLPQAFGTGAAVSVGSPASPFSQNKQNEPGLALDPTSGALAAGSNDEIDLEACAAGDPTSCPFTAGVGLSGLYLSFDTGTSWAQPTYSGWTARDCLGPDPCTAHVGPIGTLPHYYENGLVSDGDPVLAFGPRRDGSGTFSWDAGSRLYYANLASKFPASGAFKGFEAIAVSHTDDLAAAASGDASAWSDPAIVSKQNAVLFSDKESIWADNAASSPYFGNVYLCNVAFRGAVSRGGAPEPILVGRSTDGGDTWSTQQITPAANTGLGQGRQGCVVRTDSHGVVYVFFSAAKQRKSSPPYFDGAQLLARSFDGGRTFERPFAVADTVECGALDPVQGRYTLDGVAGARTDSFPSVDIANNAPSGEGASDTIVLSWCDGRNGLNSEQALVTASTDGGTTWSSPAQAAAPGDRPEFPAVAISPDGSDVYVAYMALLDPWQDTTATPRRMQGVVRHADAAALSAWAGAYRGAIGDARGSSANSLAAGFLGDYNSMVATNDFAYGVWTDVANAAVCPAVNAYRQSLVDGTPIARPAPGSDCPSTFGNTDINGVAVADPTP